MKRLTFFMMLCVPFLLFSTTAMAYPLLQLDIDGDNTSYEGGSIVSGGDPTFDLVALLNTESGKFDSMVNIGTTFTLVASWDTATGDSFTIDPLSDGVETVTLNMNPAPGNPQLNHGDLGTYAYEIDFTFGDSNDTTAYNTQLNPGGFTGDAGGTGSFRFETFAIDASLLDPFVSIHFDLYAYTLTGNPEKVFAPFSHDATHTPEPATILLLGAGLVGVAAFGRRKLKRRHS